MNQSQQKPLRSADLYVQKILLFAEVSNKSNERLCRTNNSHIASPLHVLISNGVRQTIIVSPTFAHLWRSNQGLCMQLSSHPTANYHASSYHFSIDISGSRERQSEPTASCQETNESDRRFFVDFPRSFCHTRHAYLIAKFSIIQVYIIAIPTLYEYKSR